MPTKNTPNCTLLSRAAGFAPACPRRSAAAEHALGHPGIDHALAIALRHGVRALAGRTGRCQLQVFRLGHRRGWLRDVRLSSGLTSLPRPQLIQAEEANTQ